MSIFGRLFGGDAATVDTLARAVSDANIRLSQDQSPASRAAFSEAVNAYCSAAPDSPLARQMRAGTRGVESYDAAGRTDIYVHGIDW